MYMILKQVGLDEAGFSRKWRCSVMIINDFLFFINCLTVSRKKNKTKRPRNCTRCSNEISYPNKRLSPFYQLMKQKSHYVRLSSLVWQTSKLQVKVSFALFSCWKFMDFSWTKKAGTWAEPYNSKNNCLIVNYLPADFSSLKRPNEVCPFRLPIMWVNNVGFT